MIQTPRRIAYFSMEIGLDARVPTYSGGLGVLAGDTLRAAADLRVPIIGITLLHRKGYFFQRLDAEGWQREEPVEWEIADFLKERTERVAVEIEGRTVFVRAWEYQVIGVTGYSVPVYLLDSDLPENAAWDRTLTHFLYGGDEHYRLCQEVILGIGGVRMLRALGAAGVERFHMNEGHSSLLGVELLEEEARKAGRTALTEEEIGKVRALCVFTTHTPVPSGHDQFPMELVERVLGPRSFYEHRDAFCCGDVLNMTFLALKLSHFVNGVAKRHGDVSRSMLAPFTIDEITNGIHPATWASTPFATLFDREIPGWRQDGFSLRNAMGIRREAIREAHRSAKEALLRRVNREGNRGFDIDHFTIGFARRATAYKRPGLLFTDLERLKSIAAKAGPFQVVFAGMAHPRDAEGRELIHRIVGHARALGDAVRVVYLEHYDMELARLMCAGADLWLNTPLPPFEASGTSGMKAALNGVPSLSVLDGWWFEGHIEGVTGWAIGPHRHTRGGRRDGGGDDAASLYEKLENAILPLFYKGGEAWSEIMRHCIALNGSFFNTHRMIQQYVLKAYFE